MSILKLSAARKTTSKYLSNCLELLSNVFLPVPVCVYVCTVGIRYTLENSCNNFFFNVEKPKREFGNYAFETMKWLYTWYIYRFTLGWAHLVKNRCTHCYLFFNHSTLNQHWSCNEVKSQEDDEDIKTQTKTIIWVPEVKRECIRKNHKRSSLFRAN